MQDPAHTLRHPHLRGFQTPNIAFATFWKPSWVMSTLYPTPRGHSHRLKPHEKAPARYQRLQRVQRPATGYLHKYSVCFRFSSKHTEIYWTAHTLLTTLLIKKSSHVAVKSVFRRNAPISRPILIIPCICGYALESHSIAPFAGDCRHCSEGRQLEARNY